MNNSLKIGIVAGLIAGIVGAIIRIISISIFSNTGLPYLVSFENIPKIASFEISIAIIWGIILGLVYMKARHVMPEGTILKGLVYGFLCFLIITLRDTYWLVQYYRYIFPGFVSLHLVGYIIYGLIGWITFGLVLSILYESWHKKEKIKIISYDMKSGIHPGAIAGLIGGIVAVTSIWIREYILRPSGDFISSDIALKISHAGAHTFLHMVGGVVFAVIFAKLYNLVPGKGILKGLYYSLIILISATSYIVVFWITAGLVFDNPSFSLWGSIWDVDYLALIAYGLVLGALYKPTK